MRGFDNQYKRAQIIVFLFLGAEEARDASQMSQLDAPEARSAAMALLLGGEAPR
jgi:hypothetical protein